MNASQAAYWNLVSLAKTDGDITPAERVALDRYRIALDLTTNDARTIEEELTRVPGGTFRIAGSPQDRVYILRMMAVVAYADGKLSPRERQRLERVAVALGVGPAQFADLLVTAEKDAIARSRDRGTVFAILFALVSLGLLLLVVRPSSKTQPGPSDFTKEREELAALRALVDKMTRERAEEDARRVRETQEAMRQAEAELARRVQNLEDRAAHVAPTADLAAELARLREELERHRESVQGFKEIQKRYDASVLLIFVQYDLIKGKLRETRQGCGTGFFVTPSGHIATNKHVLQPWKFIPEIVRYIEDGYQVDPKSVLIATWPAGSNARTEDGLLDLTTSYNTHHKTLIHAAAPPDDMEEREVTLEDGTTIVGTFHKQNNGDLALLKATVNAPVRAIPLAPDASGIEKLDPVMALGFPSGTMVLEARRAETSPSLGEVRKVEETILITAAIVPGNSGGPVFDLAGRAVGVSTRCYDDPSLGACIQSRHVIALLPPVPILVRQAVEYRKMGIPWAALDEACIADARGPNETQRREIETLREELLADRDRRIAEARRRVEQGDKEEARGILAKLVEEFGDTWGRPAVEALARPADPSCDGEGGSGTISTPSHLPSQSPWP